MMRLLLLAALISRPMAVAANAAVAGEVPSPSKQQRRIQRTHIFHVEPIAIVDSVISDVKRQYISPSVEGGPAPVLDIEVSSTRLDDASLASLMEGLLPLLKEKAKAVDADDDSQNETKAPLLVKLALEMNRLTSSGASGLFELLINERERDNAQESGSDSITTSNDGDEEKASPNDVAALNDEDAAEDIAEGTHTDGTETTQDETPAAVERPAFLIEEVDLSFNDIGGHGIHAPDAKLLDSTRKLFEGAGSASFVPRVLSLENCGIGPAFCRSVGRGILNAFEQGNAGSEYRPSVLRIGGNAAIADAGAVALAAALRMAGSENCVFDELDISSCGVGDAGAEALALALASNPSCVRQLDLSNNKITDAGAKALGRGLVDANRISGAVFEQLVLDNNRGIGDVGANALAEALACGAVKSISLRSCSVQAEGTAAFGKALVSLSNRQDCGDSAFCLDLSGNHFGTKKIKPKKGAMYSANLLRERASSNIRLFGKGLKSASKYLGVTGESDDEAEVMGGLIDEEEDIDDGKFHACGGHAFAREILSGATKDGVSKIYVGMRQCRLEDGAMDALSAAILGTDCRICIDVSMNSAEVEVVDALAKGEKDSSILVGMAKRHMDFMDRINDARQRQLDAAEASASLGGAFFDDEDESYDDDAYDPFDFD